MVKPEEIRDRQKLANLISQWNSEHYDLFELSPPNEVKKLQSANKIVPKRACVNKRIPFLVSKKFFKVVTCTGKPGDKIVNKFSKWPTCILRSNV